MCSLLRLVLGPEPWLFWFLASAARNRPREVTRALDGATLLMIHALHFCSIRKEEKQLAFSASAQQKTNGGGD